MIVLQHPESAVYELNIVLFQAFGVHKGEHRECKRNCYKEAAIVTHIISEIDIVGHNIRSFERNEAALLLNRYPQDGLYSLAGPASGMNEFELGSSADSSP